MSEKQIETTKAHCPKCDGERTCNVHGQTYKPWKWEDREGHSMVGGIDHSLLECMGCETVFYQADSWNDDDLDHWYDRNGEAQSEAIRTKTTYPKPDSKIRPIWLDAMAKVDKQLHEILDEMYVAYDSGAHILTAVGLRTALDRGTEVLGIDPAKTFSEKLEDLQRGGWIGATERDILEVVTDAGNAAAHRGWSPSPQEVSQLLYAMEVFLQRAFLVGQKALVIRGSIPAKPKRRAADKAAGPELLDE